MLVMGGYTLAQKLHTSGPLAMVVAGLMIGNHGRALAMSPTTRERLDTFWELLDEILNAVLFVLIGFELLILTLKAPYLVAGLLAVPTVLLSRFVSVGLASHMTRTITMTPMKLIKKLVPAVTVSEKVLVSFVTRETSFPVGFVSMKAMSASKRDCIAFSWSSRVTLETATALRL